MYTATGSCSAMPRDCRRRHASDVAMQPDTVSLLYSDVIARPLFHNLRWNCTTASATLTTYSPSSTFDLPTLKRDVSSLKSYFGLYGPFLFRQA